MPTKNKKLTKLQKAYLAGLFDGEGSIYLAKWRDGYKRNGKVYTTTRYRTLVQFSNTDVRLVNLWKDFYGGGIRQQKNHPKATKICFEWHLEDGATIALLQDIIPFLIHKKEKALKALEFVESIVAYANQCKRYKRTRKLTEIEKERRDRLLMEFKQIQDGGYYDSKEKSKASGS